PVWKGPYCQRKNDLRDTLDHEIHEQEKGESQKSFAPMTDQKHTDQHRQDNGDKLEPEMRYVARVEETDALHDTADDQEPAQKQDDRDRRRYRRRKRQNAGENHQTALYEIPERMSLDCFAHCRAHDLRGSIE